MGFRKAVLDSEYPGAGQPLMPLAVHQGSNTMENLYVYILSWSELICFSDQNHSGSYCLEAWWPPLPPGH